MATAQNVIKNFMSSLDKTSKQSTAALDEAVSAVSKFSSWSELTSTMVKDCKAYSGDYAGFLKDMCNIDLDNDDTGAITGSDAGGSVTKTAESIVPESGNWSYPTSTSFTVEGLTVTVPAQSQLNEKSQFIVGGLYTWWIKSALDLINDSYGISFETSGASVKKMDVTFYNSNNGRLAYVDYNTGQKSTELHLHINMKYYNSIDTDDPNGAGGTDSLVYLDRTIAHEMVHAVMASNVDYFNNLPTVFKEGIAELVHGIDDKRKSNITELATKSTSLNNALSGNSADTYAAGYITLRYLAKQAAADRDPNEEITVNKNTDTSTSTTTTSSTSTTPTTTNTQSNTAVATTTTVTSSATFNTNNTTLTVRGDFGTNIWLDGNVFTGQKDAYANSNTVTVDASQQTNMAIVIAGNDRSNVLTAGSGNTSLWGGMDGNDTLVGGSGRDMFWFTESGGNDVVRNFNAGTDSDSDIVNIVGGLSTMTRSNGTLFLQMGDGSSFNMNFRDSNVDKAVQYSVDASKIYSAKIGNTGSGSVLTYESNVDYYFAGGGENTLSISGGDSVNIWLDDEKFDSIQVINASNSTGNALMAGDSADNRITAGSGNASLWGGTGGNDTLIGGNGTDNFYYGRHNGNDIIQNSEDVDVINLFDISLGDVSNAVKSGGNLIITTNDGDNLTVTGNSTATFRLADGSGWKYNHGGNTWSEA